MVGGLDDPGAVDQARAAVEVRPRGSDDWGREDGWDHSDMANYDTDMHREAELDHLLPYAIVVSIVLGLLGILGILALVCYIIP